MKHYILTLLLLGCALTSQAARRTTVDKQIQDTLMLMLQRFTPYLYDDYQRIDNQYACFKGENTMGNDERGVRTNADLSMICAFLSRYAHRSDLDTMAMKTLRFAIDTHKAVRRISCKGNRYWGSVSKSDNQWESSLWAMSVAYSAWFQWDRLSEVQKGDLHKLLAAECNYELERDIPTGFRGDTKAEENGWEACVLAATLGLFPNDEMAPRWFQRLREFAVNSYSHPSDARNREVIDPGFDTKTIADLYRGANLYDDWTLQNHDFFHTSYQNVVIQELGEARLALKLFQENEEKWHTNALLHNCDSVTQHVLNWLTLPDGEQAMPNGNDWSLFLYDQITSYSTMACMTNDADALYFEQQAMRQIMHRQSTTNDGQWLLRPDVGGRRMGVQAHRVMMSWLMHEVYPVKTMKPTRWTDFLARYQGTHYFPCQQIVRTLTPKYFACFSWSKGKKNYTGYLAPLNLKNNNLVVPFHRYHTGNLLGYQVVKGHRVNGYPQGEPQFSFQNGYFSVKGTLIENDSTLKRTFTLASNEQGLSYQDEVQQLQPVTIERDYTGLTAISTDEFTHKYRQVDFSPGKTVVEGILSIQTDATVPAVFKDQSTDNSIITTKVIPYYDAPQNSHAVLWKVK